MVAIEITSFSEEVDERTVSGSTTVDLSIANTFHLTLTDDIDIEFANPTTSPEGNSLTIILEQDDDGGHSVTWPSGTVFTDGVPPDTDGDPNTFDLFTFVSPDGGSTFIGMKGVEGGVEI